MQLKKALELRINYGIEDIIKIDLKGYVCLNDMNKFFPNKRLDNWMRLDSTKEFISVVDDFLNTSDSSDLKKAMVTKRGKYNGGTFCHVDVAMEFAMWLSPEFKLTVIQSYRLGTQRQDDWNIKRIYAAHNYKLQSEAIDTSGENERMHGHGYSNNAKMINKIVFGKHEKDMRDNADENKLDQISYLQSRNGALIELGMEYEERKEILKKLHGKKYDN